jgi:hypothetical protein
MITGIPKMTVIHGVGPNPGIGRPFAPASQMKVYNDRVGEQCQETKEISDRRFCCTDDFVRCGDLAAPPNAAEFTSVEPLDTLVVLDVSKESARMNIYVQVRNRCAVC